MASDLAALILAIAMALAAPVASRAEDRAPAFTTSIDTYPDAPPLAVDYQLFPPCLGAWRCDLSKVDESSIFVTVSQPTALYVGATLIDLRTGAVRLPDGASIDQASRDFWQAVSQVFPQTCRRTSIGGKSDE